MAEVLDDLIDADAQVFDALRSIYLREETTLELLQISADHNDYDILETVGSGWYLEYQEYRNQFRLQVATAADSFKDAIAQCSHVRIGNDVYTVEASDRISPAGEEASWKLFCTRQTGRRATRTAR